MPTKTINNKLFYSVDGKEFREFKGIGDIEGAELETTTLADQQAMNDLFEAFYKPHTVTYSFNNSFVLASKFLHVLCGKSNNWLRLHGLPMVRRKAR